MQRQVLSAGALAMTGLVVIAVSAIASERAGEEKQSTVGLPGLASQIEYQAGFPAAAARAAKAASSSTSVACVVFPGDGRPETEVRPGWSGPALSYTDNGDGTLTDDNTGLMWEQKAPGGGGAATCLTALHGVDSECNWTDATGGGAPSGGARR